MPVGIPRNKDHGDEMHLSKPLGQFDTLVCASEVYVKKSYVRSFGGHDDAGSVLSSGNVDLIA